jgi:hypothetical protein
MAGLTVGDGLNTLNNAIAGEDFDADYFKVANGKLVTICRQHVKEQLPFPAAFPICLSTTTGTAVSFTDAASVQTYLTANFPGLTYDTTNSQIRGCVRSDLNFDFKFSKKVTTSKWAVNGTTVTLGPLASTQGNVSAAIDWGDGTTGTIATDGAATVTHTYAAAFAGDVTIALPGPCAELSRFDGSGNWSFDVGKITSPLKRLSIGDGNTTSGLISALPAGLAYYENSGQNTTSGLISDLPAGLTFYSNSGQNTTSGLISALPAGLTVYINSGQNTTSGLISALPAGLTVYINSGQNTTSGLISALPAGLTVYINSGQNTTSGLISDLPAGLTYYSNYGQNTTSGLISALPAGLTFYSNYGQNTTSGSASATMPPATTSFADSGGMSAAEVASVLIKINSFGTSNGTINLTGSSLAPTAAGVAAKTALISRGWTVTTN